jgi:hypothetical protein
MMPNDPKLVEDIILACLEPKSINFRVEHEDDVPRVKTAIRRGVTEKCAAFRPAVICHKTRLHSDRRTLRTTAPWSSLVFPRPLVQVRAGVATGAKISGEHLKRWKTEPRQKCA